MEARARTIDEQRDADADEFEALVDQYGIEGVLLGNMDFEVTHSARAEKKILLVTKPLRDSLTASRTQTQAEPVKLRRDSYGNAVKASGIVTRPTPRPRSFHLVESDSNNMDHDLNKCTTGENAPTDSSINENNRRELLTPHQEQTESASVDNEAQKKLNDPESGSCPPRRPSAPAVGSSPRSATGISKPPFLKACSLIMECPTAEV